ncbi:MAG: LrgB family protein [Desulfarculaceae bacterium]|jgi:predicted murein hydrolase (TIGR00659 family)
MEPLLKSPIFAVAITVAIYFLAQRLYRRWPLFFLNPVMISIAALICLLKLIGLDYQTYFQGGRFISFFLGPAVVALGVPLFQQMETIKKQSRAILCSTLAAAVVGVASAALTALCLGASYETAASLAPKSVTTPIAMGIAQKLGGIPSLTAALVIAAGVLGAVLGPGFLRLAGVRSPSAFGLALGSAAHGIGTARALEEGQTQGALAGLGICLNGLATALTAPFLLKLFVWFLGG